MVLNENYQLVAEVYYGSLSGYDQLYLQLWAKLDSQSIANNKSTVTLLARMKNTGYYSYSYQCYCNLNDKMVQNNTYIYFTGNATIDLGTNQIEIDHNPNGTATGISKWVKFSSSGMSEKTASGSFDLPTIPRYATCQQSLASKTETSITMNWSSDNTIDRVWYSKDGGTTWTLVGDVNATSGSYTISGLTANTTYSIKTRVRRKDSQLTTDSTATSVTTYKIVAQSMKSKTVNSITMNWSLDGYGRHLWYSIDNGSTWVDVGNINAVSGTYTISGLAPNTLYSIKTRVLRATTQTLSVSATLAVTTYDIAKITGSANWTIGNNTSVSYTNPSGASISIGIFNTAGNVAYASYRTPTSSPYTFQFTSVENTALYNSIPNSTNGTVRIYLRTTANGTSYYSAVDRTIFIDQASNKPTFANFTFADVNTNVTTLTGNNQILVKGLSNVTVTISTANKAVAKNGASIVKYRVTIGTKSTEVNYSSSADVTATINAVDGASISVSAIDSRGLENTVVKTATWKDYSKPSITKMELKRENAIGTKVFFDFEADYWNGNFGATENVIDNVKFRYMPKGGSYSSWVNITNSIQYADGKVTTIAGSFLPTTNNGSTPIEFLVGTEYYVQFHIDDSTLYILSVNSTAQPINSGIPCTDKYKDNNSNYHVGVNQMADPNYALAVGGRMIESDTVKEKWLSTAGWYRVAEIPNSNTASIFNISTTYNNRNNTSFTLVVNTAHNTATMNLLNICNNYNIIYYAKIMQDNGKNYLEIYYNADVGNTVRVEMISKLYNVKLLDFISSPNTGTNIVGITIPNNNIEVLYNNATGSNGTITLNETASIFSFFDIYFRDATSGANNKGCVRVYSPNGAFVPLNLLYSTGSTNIIKSRMIYISGTNIATAGSNYGVTTMSTNNSISQNNTIYIIRVDGYRSSWGS